MFDNTPGSPDGPPLFEKKNIWYYLGVLVAIMFIGTVVGLFFAGAWWAFLWLVTNMPG